MEVISSRISGWRVTDSMTLPKMMPMPTPAPTAPRPPPTPSAMALPSLPVLAEDWASSKIVPKRCSIVAPLFSVAFRRRFAKVDGGERGEDERLQGCDQPDLEDVDGDAERQRDQADRDDAEQHDEGAGHEQDDQVPRQDVGEETNGERDQSHEVRHDLEPEDERGQGPGDAGRDELLEVA